MCVIIAKNKGIKLPTTDILRQCWNRNPDGAGFMWYGKNHMVHGTKGFMCWGEFKSAWEEHAFSIKDTVVIHFRLATSGGIRPENCHPFPVSKTLSELKKTSFSSNMGIVHNGIFGSGTDDLSDTMVWVKDTLFPIRDYVSDNQEFIEEDLGYNRVAIMGSSIQQPILLGVGWRMLGGLWFSNWHWMEKFEGVSDSIHSNIRTRYLK